MTQDDGGYDLKPEEPRPPAPEPTPAAELAGEAKAVPARPKPGEPGWVPPVPIIEKADPEPEESGDVASDPDVEQHKGMAVLAYVCFIIPLVVAPKSSYARFHANQGLLTFIIWCVAVVANVVLWGVHTLMERFLTIPVLYGFFTCIFYVVEPALMLAALAASIYGMIQAANGERKGLPLFGQMTLIK